MKAKRNEPDSVRQAAQPVGSRVLEMHAGTPRINQWYYDKFREHTRG